MIYTQEQFGELQTKIRCAIAESDEPVATLCYGLVGEPSPELTDEGVDYLAQIARVQVESWLQSVESKGTWSKDAPTEPSHFWFRPSDLTQFKQVVQVSRNALGNLRVSIGVGGFHPVEDLKGLWWTERLPEPGEAK